MSTEGVGSPAPRVAVFGASGFCGRHFERFVAGEGLAERYAFVGHTRRAAAAEQTGAFTYQEGDPTAPGEVARFVADVRPDYVLNLVGRFSAADLEEFVALHVGVAGAICDAVLAAGLKPKKLVFVGSAAEYGSSATNPVAEDALAQPVNPYGLSKLYQTLLADYHVRNHGLPIVVARTFNILGEGLSADLSIGSFSRQIEDSPDGGTLRVGNLATSRDFLDVGDVAKKYWTLLMRGEPGQIYNVCSGRPRSMQSVLDELIARSGKRLAIEVDPRRMKARDVSSIYGDPSKLERLGS